MNAPECTSSSLEQLPSSVLAKRLDQMMTRERHCLVEFLLHLAAFDRRRGHLELGYRSLFAYCTDCLKMSNGTAYRRTTAARLIVRFPAALEHLRDGRLSNSSLCELRDVLSAENHRALLDRASGMNEDEAKMLAASLNPKADVTDSIRRVPVRAVAVLRPSVSSPIESINAPPESLAEDHNDSREETKSESSSAPALDDAAGTAEMAWVTLPPKPSELDPLSAGRYALRMTVSQEFVDEFRRVKDALSHVVPTGKMEDVFFECLRITREVCERRTLGSKSRRATRGATNADAATSILEVNAPVEPIPPPEPEIDPSTSTLEVSEAGTSTLEVSEAGTSVLEVSEAGTSIVEVSEAGTSVLEVSEAGTSILEASEAGTSILELFESGRAKSSSRYIPVTVRREVFHRDESCCTFVGANGRRCRSTYQLQFHHKVPFGWGGPPTAENLTLHCARHNRHQAYEDYGADHIEKLIARRVEQEPEPRR